jgi:hypothetical protein
MNHVKRNIIICSSLLITVVSSAVVFFFFNHEIPRFTVYAPGYRDDLFDRIRPGDTAESMMTILGKPLSYSQDDKHPGDTIAYYSDAAYSFKDPEPVRIRRVVLRDGLVVQKIRALGTAWDSVSYGREPLMKRRNISDEFRIMYDESGEKPYRIEKLVTENARGKYSELFTLLPFDRQSFVGYTREYKDMFIARVYRFSEPVSFHTATGNDMVVCVRENSAYIEKTGYFLIDPRGKTCTEIPLADIEVTTTAKCTLRKKPSRNARAILKVPEGITLHLKEISANEDIVTIQNHQEDIKQGFTKVNGSWILCSAPSGETGWCFDAYLRYSIMKGE